MRRRLRPKTARRRRLRDELRTQASVQLASLKAGAQRWREGIRPIWGCAKTSREPFIGARQAVHCFLEAVRSNDVAFADVKAQIRRPRWAYGRF